MPIAPLRYCGRPGHAPHAGSCPLCIKGQRRASDERRGSARERGYDRAWEKFRAAFLSEPENVICWDCHRAESTDVHHRKKLAEHPELKYERSNLLALCGECHDIRTGRGE